MPKTLIILGHQRAGSFCHAIALTAMEEFAPPGTTSSFTIFTPRVSIRFWPTPRYLRGPSNRRPSPDIAAKLVEVETIVVVHPNWWAMPPAVLKGWLDRVLRQGVAYEFGPAGVIGKLAGKRAIVFTTSNTPREDELQLFGDPLENLWKTCIFGFCGLTDFCRRNFESIIMSTPQQRAGWLEEVREIVREGA